MSRPTKAQRRAAFEAEHGWSAAMAELGYYPVRFRKESGQPTMYWSREERKRLVRPLGGGWALELQGWERGDWIRPADAVADAVSPVAAVALLKLRGKYDHGVSKAEALRRAYDGAVLHSQYLDEYSPLAGRRKEDQDHVQSNPV